MVDHVITGTATVVPRVRQKVRRRVLEGAVAALADTLAPLLAEVLASLGPPGHVVMSREVAEALAPRVEDLGEGVSYAVVDVLDRGGRIDIVIVATALSGRVVRFPATFLA